MVDADQNVLTLALDQPLITHARAFFHGGSELLAIAQQACEFFLEILFPFAQFRHQIIGVFLGFISLLSEPHDVFLRRFRLLHQSDFLILDLGDVRLAGVNFVGKGLVFLVLARLQLLVGVLGDLGLFGFHVEFEPFPVGFDLPHPLLARLQIGLRARSLVLEGLPFGFDVSEFRLQPADFTVAILQNEEFLNGF